MGDLTGIRRTQPRSSGVFIDPRGFTGIAAAGGQLARAGAATFTAFKEQQEKRNTELAKADFESMKAATTGARNDFLKSLRTTDKDYGQINEAWNTQKKKIFKEIGKSTNQPKAQKAYGRYVGAVVQDWDKDVDNIAWGVSVPRAKTQMFNAATEILRNTPDYNEALLEASLAINSSDLLSTEEKQFTLADAAVETNPQWYVDNIDTDLGREVFDKLTQDEKDELDGKANSSMNRIRTEQQRANVELNNETRKAASDRWASNTLTSDWLKENRPNMAASDYERYNTHLVNKAKEQESFQKNLDKIEDTFNREIFGKLDLANTPDELEALQDTVNDYASPEQKKLSVDEAQDWTTQIEAKEKELQTSKAESYPTWAALSDRITAVQAGTAQIEAVQREIDRAVVPPEGEAATITPELAMSLRTRLDGIERNPTVKTRPSMTRAQARIGRLRTLQVGLITQKDPETPQFVEAQRGIVTEDRTADEIIIDIENSITNMQAELDDYADTIANDPDFDNKLNKKLQDLTRPMTQRVVLNDLSKFFRKEKGVQFFGLITSEEKALINKKVKALKKQPVWSTLSEEEKKEAKQAFENGFTVDDIVRELSQ